MSHEILLVERDTKVATPAISHGQVRGEIPIA